MVESSASSGSPEYLLAGREGETMWKARPLEMYYRPRPTDVQKATVTCLYHSEEKNCETYTNHCQDSEIMYL